MKYISILVLVFLIGLAISPLVVAQETDIPTTIVTAQETIQETIKDIQPSMWKDTTPKLSKNTLIFGTEIPQQVIITDADNKNVTLSTLITKDNQIDLPIDVSEPGKIAIKIQVDDVVYVIRRNV